MALSDELRQVELGPAHVGAALKLSAEAGWNQIAADWQLMIGRGRAFGLEAPDGTLAASALTLPYPDGGFAWISMVLVTQPWRRRGLATRLVRTCIDTALGLGLAPVLDATPAGAAVYAAMGFVPSFGLLRMQRLGPPAAATPSRAPDLARIAATDRAVFGGDRGFILEDMARRAPALARAEGGGYAFGRDGRTAWQVGPITANDLATAMRLAVGLPAPVFMDVPEQQAGFVASLEARGFTVQRPYTRMAYRRAPDWGDPARTFAIAGPELG